MAHFLTFVSKHLQVSILNGIVMGGGAGASMHGRFRVVTENTVCFVEIIIM
jgi:3-hydroxyisobutyryl-CoA hydrolase